MRWRCASALALALPALGCGANGQAAIPRASGYVEATEVRVASKVPGRVERVEAREGARVAEGDRLAQVFTTDVDFAIQRARAERAHAVAQLKLLQAGARPEDLDQAQAQLAAAEAERRAGEAELEAARADEARFRQLIERKAGATKQLDDAITRRQLAEARVRAAGDRAAAAQAARARVAAGARPEEVEAARARVAAVDAEIAALERDRAEAAITSPLAGVVTARLVEPGELVAAGTPVAVVVDLDRAWVNAYIEEPLIPRLRLDQPMTVVTDAGDRLEGRVSFIAPRAEFTPRNVQTSAERARLVYRVKVSVDNREGVLKPGMPVEVSWQ
jgi:HlyD family secretion protein